MRLLIAFIALLGWCGTMTSSAQTLKLYVAPNGNDNWSGRLPTPNAKRADGPFATLHRARDFIRELKRQGKFPKNGVIVEVRAGIYELSTP
ncbi:MAG: right-handed parallel beta-helix repeat-containing protein, partial [Armatimonadota bacterium]